MAGYSSNGGLTWSDSEAPTGFTRGDTFGAAREYWNGAGDPSVATDTRGNFRVEVHDVVANDEHAVGLNSVHAERAGTTLEDNNTLVFHVRAGKVTEVWQYWSDQYAADDLFG